MTKTGRATVTPATKTKRWAVPALSEDGRTAEGFFVVAFRATKYPGEKSTTPFVTVEGKNLPDPCMTPGQAARLSRALASAAKWVRR